MLNNCSSIAPIVIFAYKRKDHLEKVVDSLLKNALAKESEVFFFCDGARGGEDYEAVKTVRLYVDSIEGFSSIHRIYRGENIGLARNIEDGVSFVIEQYNKIIVLEDDIIVSPLFLDYMNKALEYYESSTEVMAISARTEMPEIYKDHLPDHFFLPWFSCWGWATWRDRWGQYTRNYDFIFENVDKKMIKHVNYNGTYDIWGQMVSNYEGKLNTWAVFFYVVIILNHGLVLYGKNNYSINIGFDGSGENSGIGDEHVEETDFILSEDIIFPSDLAVDKNACKAYERFYFYNSDTWWGRLLRGGHYLRKKGIKAFVKRFDELFRTY